MPLIRDNGAVEADDWTHLDDEAPLPDDGAKVIVSLARWRADRDALVARNAPVGVVLAAGDGAEDIADDLDRLALVALTFPKFSDGRAYSLARVLRGRYRFAGELRAVGNVLRDQLLFMHRCGFNAFALQKGDAVEAWTRALAEFSAWYQPAADGRPVAARQRLRGEARVRPRAVAAAAAPAPAVSCCAGDWAY